MVFSMAVPLHIIFCDVDGVLNSTQPDSPSLGVEEKHLRLLAHAARSATGPGLGYADTVHVKVVVSSDWRRDAALMARLLPILTGAGVEVLGTIAPDLSKERGIRRWLSEHGDVVRNWVAIDDMDLLGRDAFACGDAHGRSVFQDHFVQTDEAVGFTENNAADVVRLLAAAWEHKAKDMASFWSSSADLDTDMTNAACVCAAVKSTALVCDECGCPLRDPEAARIHMEETMHCMFSSA